MIRRAALAFGLLSVVLLAQSGTVYAQAAKMSFEWATYNVNGKEYTSPQWAADGGNVKLVSANLRVTVGSSTVKSGKMYVRTPGVVPGSWNTTPVISDTSITVGAKVVPGNTQLLIGQDKAIPKVAIPSGTSVQFSWELVIESDTGVQSEITITPGPVTAQPPQ